MAFVRCSRALLETHTGGLEFLSVELFLVLPPTLESVLATASLAERLPPALKSALEDLPPFLKRALPPVGSVVVALTPRCSGSRSPPRQVRLAAAR